ATWRPRLVAWTPPAPWPSSGSVRVPSTMELASRLGQRVARPAAPQRTNYFQALAKTPHGAGLTVPVVASPAAGRVANPIGVRRLAWIDSPSRAGKRAAVPTPRAARCDPVPVQLARRPSIPASP